MTHPMPDLSHRPSANRHAQLFTLNVDDDQRLNINEVPVYPLPLSHTVVPLTIVAQQIRVADRVASAPIPLGHALEIYPEDWDTEEPDKKLVVTKFTILDLNGIPVKVDTVKISLLQTEAKDEIMRTVVKIETIPFNETPGADTCQGQAKWSLCRLRAIILARVSQLVAAAKAHAKAAHKWMKPAGCRGRKFGKHGKPGHHGHHGPHGHHGLHRAMHRFGHMMHQAIRFFIIPALLGVIGGLMASAIGMLVGQFIVYMWFRFRRRGERGPVRHGEVVLVEEEKDELLAEEGELPPAYEDADIPNEAVEKH